MGCAHQEGVVAVFDLLDGVGVVIAGGGVVRKEIRRRIGVGTYEVTGMSPQSRTLPQKLKGFSARGLQDGQSFTLTQFFRRCTHTL